MDASIDSILLPHLDASIDAPDAAGEDAVSDASGDESQGYCAPELCPEPPFTGLEKCCTDDGYCGYRSGAGEACHAEDGGAGGSGGSGGTGGYGP